MGDRHVSDIEVSALRCVVRSGAKAQTKQPLAAGREGTLGRNAVGYQATTTQKGRLVWSMT